MASDCLQETRELNISLPAYPGTTTPAPLAVLCTYLSLLNLHNPVVLAIWLVELGTNLSITFPTPSGRHRFVNSNFGKTGNCNLHTNNMKVDRGAPR